MKILINSSFPFSFGGFANQINYLLSQIHDYNSCIEIGILYAYNSNDTFKEDILPKELINNYINALKFPDYYIKYTYFNFGSLYKDFWKKLEKFVNIFRADITLIYHDLFYIEGYNIGKLKCKLFIWLPIHDTFKTPDGKTTTQDYTKTLEYLVLFDKIITFSKFGEAVIKSYNYESVFINHFIDNTIFYPKYSKKDIRDVSDNRFLCLMVANSFVDNRKGCIECIEAFTKFKCENKFLIIKNLSPYCYILEELILPEVKDKVLFLKDPMDTDSLVKLYCSADVLLAAACSEGFGIPIVEAQMCGLPVITTNCTAMTENTYIGICVEPEMVSEKIENFNSWSKPSVTGIVKALEDIKNGNYDRKPLPSYGSEWDKWKKLFGI